MPDVREAGPGLAFIQQGNSEAVAGGGRLPHCLEGAS